LDSKSEEEIKEFSKMIKKHLIRKSKRHIKFFEKYQNFENVPFTKATNLGRVSKRNLELLRYGIENLLSR